MKQQMRSKTKWTRARAEEVKESLRKSESLEENKDTETKRRWRDRGRFTFIAAEEDSDMVSAQLLSFFHPLLRSAPSSRLLCPCPWKS